MNINSIRTARRMAVAASGMVAAVSLVIGAGAASAGPVLAAADSPTKISCVGSPTTCYVHDGDGIKYVQRWKSDTSEPASHTVYNGAKDVAVLSEGKYDTFVVRDMRGFWKTYSFTP